MNKESKMKKEPKMNKEELKVNKEESKMNKEELKITKEDLNAAVSAKVLKKKQVDKLWEYLEKKKLKENTLRVTHLILPEKAIVVPSTNSKKIQLDIKCCENLSPLIIFVNSKSGAQQGREVLNHFRKLLNPNQVFDLIEDKGPERGLELFKDFPNVRVLICGGDGTVGWYFSAIDAIDYKNPPPIAILPLGTGNDLARTLGWGGGYDDNNLSSFLEKVHQSKEALLDRWKIEITPKESSNTQPLKRTMTNYFSIGLDANIALEFHKEREAHPEKFDSRLGNKFQYFKIGNKSLFEKPIKIEEIVKLEYDGTQINISNAESIIFLNISSFMSGSNLWGQTGSKKWKPQMMNDKLLEIVTVSGTTEFFMIKTGLIHAHRLAQVSQIKLEILHSVSVQQDGEPWVQDPCTITISLFSQDKVLTCE